MKTDIRSLNLDEIKEEIQALGFQSFRAKQINDWLNKGVNSFFDMKNLPQDLTMALNDKFEFSTISINTKLVSKIDGTIKYLFELCDGEMIEAVVMRYKYGLSMCISTQVGCKMGCKFCATGLSGFSRNLSPSEMLGEIITAQKDIGERISHVVLMGMGEPLDNYDNVLKFLKLVTSKDNICIGARNISISTCGIVPRIYDLANEKLQVTLSISLHAPNNELRGKTMPVNSRWDISELIDACKYYISKTGRRISFEYAMISGVNDSAEDARELARLLKGMLCHVNLIPTNQVKENSFCASSSKTINDFIIILNKSGINATIRRTLGSDINASCGQLRGKSMNKR